ncbi:hypothetical protein L2735_14095 [Shewanella olleyana]|uniref:hypothetical protein n=1 Tax=Shewanella olleyana TaxID=135626 RepID=UPI00200D9713|nr:hypothetical protein [Shewanella olleyana]MCL1067922.1 hypothetical protein [Shewanella olleyana]
METGVNFKHFEAVFNPTQLLDVFGEGNVFTLLDKCFAIQVVKGVYQFHFFKRTKRKNWEGTDDITDNLIDIATYEAMWMHCDSLNEGHAIVSPFMVVAPPLNTVYSTTSSSIPFPVAPKNYGKVDYIRPPMVW